ncbi:pseudouridine synthase [Taylorella equigenitalis]|uniref:Pseudouridylate synthase n=1 Tax=Taylorella equigenitalis 14/56 TaxID=1091497 RepID=I7JPR2_9BURK|nr:pseudouridine synthase [Taylorella equigenitalis]WDU46401.1 pseudouridine synthase [Taylorella equigenitalis]WDU47884.1 pseudouridine synthase [Taylorella equigenitalis]WDU49394.1 pseudouridine synthase [Taylorella equigenitalis]WDU51872.1 pseudouridine synthase [Taylorella equigenitalis]WDU53377.1 pseudouridine synthase [Taylorella equigenitalis]
MVMLQSPLPDRDGITASRLYLPRENWSSLIDFLIFRFPHIPPTILQKRLKKGDFVNSEGISADIDSPYVPDSWLWYFREVDEEPTNPFELTILYEDDLIVAIDKPHLLASVPGGYHLHESALIKLRRLLNNININPIHRLDRETAGVLVFCKQSKYRNAYQVMFQDRVINKSYECIAPKPIDLSIFPLVRKSYICRSNNFFTMIENTELIPNSETRIEFVHTVKGGNALYRLFPSTGKKHQLRVHMSGLGLPIVYDNFYPVLLAQRDKNDFSNPLQLLARSIEFKDPISGEHRYFESHQKLELDTLDDLDHVKCLNR